MNQKATINVPLTRNDQGIIQWEILTDKTQFSVSSGLRKVTELFLRRCEDICKEGLDNGKKAEGFLKNHLLKATRAMETKKGAHAPYVQVDNGQIVIFITRQPGSKDLVKEIKTLLRFMNFQATLLDFYWKAKANPDNTYHPNLSKESGIIDEYVERKDYITPMLELAIRGIIHPLATDEKLLFSHPILPKKDQLWQTIRNRRALPYGAKTLKIPHYKNMDNLQKTLEEFNRVSLAPGTYKKLADHQSTIDTNHFSDWAMDIQVQNFLCAFNETHNIILRKEIGRVDLSTQNYPEHLLKEFENHILQALKKLAGVKITGGCHKEETHNDMTLASVFSYRFKNSNYQEQADEICQRHLEKNPPPEETNWNIPRYSNHTNGMHGYRQILQEKGHSWLKWTLLEDPYRSRSQASRILSWIEQHIDELNDHVLDALTILHPHLRKDEILQHKEILAPRFKKSGHSLKNPFYREMAVNMI